MSLKYSSTLSDGIGLGIDLVDITDRLGKILDKFGLVVDNYHAYSDSVTGDVFINLTDNEGDSIDTVLMVDDDDVPGFLILGKHDLGVGWIDLQGIVPVIKDKIDFGNGSWFRYSILTNLLELGKVDFRRIKESKSKNVVRTITRIEEAFSVRGKSKISVVSHRSRNHRLTTRQVLGLATFRQMIQKSVSGNDEQDDSARVTKLERHIAKFLGGK